MPKIDFSKINDANNYEPIPEGKYLCELSEVEEKQTKTGDEMWNLKFAVVYPLLHEGRVIFDRMVFSEKAMSRVKLICSRLGIETKGIVDLDPKDILHQQCYLNLIIEDYTSEEGVQKKRNTVPYAGYEKVEASAQVEKKEPVVTRPELEDDEIPF